MLRRASIEGERLAWLDGHPVEPRASRPATSDPPLHEALTGALYTACYAGLPWPGGGVGGAGADGGGAARDAEGGADGGGSAREAEGGAVGGRAARDAEGGAGGGGAGGGGAVRDERGGAPRDLRAALSRANAGRDVWEDGWRFVRSAADGRAVARRGTVVRAWWPGHWVRSDGAPGAAVPGTPMRVLHAAEPRDRLMDGWWFCGGRGGPDADVRRVRVYFNAGDGNAPALVAALTGRLHALEVPFQLKVADRVELIGRRDSAVLYTEARHFRVVASVAAAVAAGLAEPLAPETPPFARRLAPGVAMAEDSGGPASFGVERCALVARGMWRAHERGALADDARLDAVGEAFAEAGLDLERPWLAARDNPDRYDLAA
ncbi:MAG TPA: T3SS effector HopA1 family protein [Solirubrobacteraceae bacterium]|nr:T3SS effector HopA1 family protein [Solirubrobacteraceae bacterium]